MRDFKINGKTISFINIVNVKKDKFCKYPDKVLHIIPISNPTNIE